MSAFLTSTCYIIARLVILPKHELSCHYAVIPVMKKRENKVADCHNNNKILCPYPPISQPVPNISQPTNRNYEDIINKFLSDQHTYKLDFRGVAFFPMNKIQPTINDERINMLMVIEAPPAKELYKLYTNFTGVDTKALSNGCLPKSNEYRVLNKLIERGKHQALTLTKVCDEKLRFCYEGKVTEIASVEKFRGVVKVFVDVSVRMKKQLASVPPSSAARE